jgi:hypothetical protein
MFEAVLVTYVVHEIACFKVTCHVFVQFSCAYSDASPIQARVCTIICEQYLHSCTEN